MDKTICELFAGVGGFRLGFERQSQGWDTVWFSQWEPNAKHQWAHECYVKHFGDSLDVNGEYHTNDDIGIVDKSTIPNHNLLVGGFPCQDYSIARSLLGSDGIEGKKGVLWWQIYETIKAKQPPFCLFENVDRLLKSPSKQHGRDFGIMLACLNSLGYSVEWRVINAAMYGNPQRRKRTYIFVFRNDTEYYKKAKEMLTPEFGIFAKAFPADISSNIETYFAPNDPIAASESFSFDFKRAGIMIDQVIMTCDIEERQEPIVTLASILEHNVSDEYYVQPDKIEKWHYAKSAKKVERNPKNGHAYTFSEGAVPFPDPIDRPARTILTSETSLSRTSHIIKDPGTNRLRTLTPIETERLNGFDDNWTENMPKHMRYFCMGNALVVPVITRIARELDNIFNKEKI